MRGRVALAGLRLGLALALGTGCGALEDAAGDRSGGKADDKPDAVPLTLPPSGPPTSELQTTVSDPVRAYCDAVNGVVAAVQAGGLTAAQGPLEQLAAASEGLAAVTVGPQELQAVTSCTAALQGALNPVGN